MAKRLGESGTRPVCRPPSKKARPDRARLQVFALAAGYPPMAFSIDIDTPGPMVEHREIFFM